MTTATLTRITRTDGTRNDFILRYIVQGDRGAVNFTISLHSITPTHERHSDLYPATLRVFPSDIGYHSHKPMYAGQTALPCDILDGDCYYDGSGLRALSWYADLDHKELSAVWEKLEAEYGARFGVRT